MPKIAEPAPQFRSAPVMKAAPDPTPATAVNIEAVPPVGTDAAWHTMDEAPRDGTYLYLKPDDGAVPREWFWYKTRQFRKGVWQATGWWRERFGPASPPKFTPVGWRRVSEGIA